MADEPQPSPEQVLRPVIAPVQIPADLPDCPSVQAEMERWMRLLVEVLTGRRPVRQLSGVATRPVLRYLQATVRGLTHPRSGGAAAGARPPARVIVARVCQPHLEAAEVAGVCVLGGRVRAVAVRFERRVGGAWFCAVIRVG